MILKPAAFQACFANWLQSCAMRPLRRPASSNRSWRLMENVAAKSRSQERSRALHSVSVWASEFGLSLGQVACARNPTRSRPSRVTAACGHQGAIITIDAMGTQKAIASQIVEGEADYVLALKGNQETLHQAVMGAINKEWENDFADVKASRLQTSETAHGRAETRTYIQMAVPESLPGLKPWKGLKSIGVVVSDCVRNGKKTSEVRYYISSLNVDAKRFAHAVRSHWGIENACHWSLDVTYREDESRIREKHLRENFAWLNRLTLSLLKQHPGRDSLVMKRRSCGWSDDFLLQVLAGSTL
ncbi:ISAs1 family transposase [Singulisphaera sp. Ch08]|uniref:ISAs1 family transposase n=1 Tax=Singulisphaera sp. Ch08 TaxID=3120278 RepID=A0AAU7CJE5_9BACT